MTPPLHHSTTPSPLNALPWLPIMAILPDGEDECLCIAVDHATRCYVTGSGIVTHNSGTGMSTPFELSSRDWPEDFEHENGNYLNECIKCNRTFIGHKRRHVCKECAADNYSLQRLYRDDNPSAIPIPNTGGESSVETPNRLKNLKCPHQNFDASVRVNRHEDSGRFSAEVRIACTDCGEHFRFLGLPAGLDLNGATVSVDGEEARLAIGTAESVANILDGNCPVGFTVRKG